MKNSQMTNYNEIFENTSWGKNLSNNNVDIINNRNFFVEEYSIKKNIDVVFSAEEYSFNIQYFDHLEYYKNDLNEIIVIYSNYGTKQDIMSDFLKFTEYKKLYTNDTITYISKFDSISDLKNKIKSCYILNLTGPAEIPVLNE